MRIVNDTKEYLGNKPDVQETKKEEVKQESFNDILVKELGNECYGVNFFGSIGVHKKACGLCDLTKFFWTVSKKTLEIKMKIEEFLLTLEVDFTYPQIDAVKLNKEDSVFEQALNYENKRIEHLYEVIEKAPCKLTKGLVGKLIKKHVEIQHLLSLANKISKLSDDPLLIQKSVCKLICHE